MSFEPRAGWLHRQFVQNEIAMAVMPEWFRREAQFDDTRLSPTSITAAIAILEKRIDQLKTLKENQHK